MPRRTHKTRSHRCSFCGRRFDDGGALSRHRLEQHLPDKGSAGTRSRDGYDIPDFSTKPVKPTLDAENDRTSNPNRKAYRG